MNARHSTSRRLDRWDGLILILATAVAILGPTLFPGPAPTAIPLPPWIDLPPPPVIAPSGPAASTGDLLDPVPIPDDGVPYSAYLEWLVEISIAYVAIWTPALWIIRMRRPRPRWHRLIRQPGLAASSVGLLVFAIVFATDLLRWAASRSGHSGGLQLLQDA